MLAEHALYPHWVISPATVVFWLELFLGNHIFYSFSSIQISLLQPQQSATHLLKGCLRGKSYCPLPPFQLHSDIASFRVRLGIFRVSYMTLRSLLHLLMTAIDIYDGDLTKVASHTWARSSLWDLALDLMLLFSTLKNYFDYSVFDFFLFLAQYHSGWRKQRSIYGLCQYPLTLQGIQY